ncbi:glycosyltransferase family 39 protein [Kamptonema sp. UHCC 0994]|uniref:glycosyltransferase family 39 protein n=1 Tax=Kamptonema sp. UHCC 0994 TaxID=3031329 RepID=UPI0023BA798F|nr:glycosyltransferase family 39 protein [Kamptonema sp. UHCC 0994]MDF0556889.1 glycosyltransferase family 39 protein [Kamptonema sp. UHCC 0994]
MKNTKKNTANITIVAVLLVALLMRLLLPVLALIITQDLELFNRGDTLSYTIPAKKLIELGQFLNIDNQPELFRTPGYPLLLIPGLLAGNVEIVTIFIQIILDCLTVYLIYKIALLLFKRDEIAIVCALLYAIEPLPILRSSFLMSETLHTTLLTLFLKLLLEYFKNNSGKNLALAAITLAASIYVRPIGYYLPLLITAILLVWNFKKMQARKFLIIHTCIFLVVAMGSVGIWQIRNYVKAGYSGIAAVSDYNLYCYNGASLIARQKKVSSEEVHEQLGCTDREKYFQIYPEQRQWSQSQIYRYMGKEGKKIIMSDPLTYSIVHLEGMFRTLIQTPTNRYVLLLMGMFEPSITPSYKNLYQYKDIVFWTNLNLSLLLGVYLLGVTTALLSKRFLNNLSMITLVSVAVYFLTVSGGDVGSHRFRLAITPIICLLAGYGLSLIINRIKHQFSPSANN